MTEDYVSFETAKLLKEKGFKGGGNYFYEEGTIIDFNNYWWRITPKERYASIQAPTLQMAMKWLREKYHIFICTLFLEDKDAWGFTIEDTSAKKYLATSRDTTYESYESACEFAIKYCLKNLI